MALAAAKHISSVMVRARTSRVPRKIPGNPSELLTWLSKSERPVATRTAPAAFASHGHISGTGFAHEKTIASFAIVSIHSGRITPGPERERAITTSAPLIASGILPSRFSILVIWHHFHLSSYSSL